MCWRFSRKKVQRNVQCNNFMIADCDSAIALITPSPLQCTDAVSVAYCTILIALLKFEPECYSMEKKDFLVSCITDWRSSLSSSSQKATTDLSASSIGHAFLAFDSGEVEKQQGSEKIGRLLSIVDHNRFHLKGEIVQSCHYVACYCC